MKHNLEKKLIGVNRGKQDSHTRMESPMVVDGSKKEWNQQLKTMQEFMKQFSSGTKQPSAKNDNSACDNKACFYCDKMGHMAKDCRQRKDKEVGVTGKKSRGYKA